MTFAEPAQVCIHGLVQHISRVMYTLSPCNSHAGILHVIAVTSFCMTCHTLGVWDVPLSSSNQLQHLHMLAHTRTQKLQAEQRHDAGTNVCSVQWLSAANAPA